MRAGSLALCACAPDYHFLLGKRAHYPSVTPLHRRVRTRHLYARLPLLHARCCHVFLLIGVQAAHMHDDTRDLPARGACTNERTFFALLLLPMAGTIARDLTTRSLLALCAHQQQVS